MLESTPRSKISMSPACVGWMKSLFLLRSKHQAFISGNYRHWNSLSSNSSQHLGFTWTLKLCHFFNNGRPNRQMNLQKMMTSLMLLFLPLLRNSLGLW
ncbi:uncharacterized protein LOC126612141 [Malus sylvestris]|uniref:uncharacterized protein LOC126612141 n=1 Tax=Malus sylvestris TaxID=3752 RepID=UPI0021ABD939|nr:uncharacterized protein LOC126612141 [Malus sylvestris]